MVARNDQIPGKGLGILQKPVLLFGLIGLGRRKRIANHLPHPFREPAFNPHVDGKPGKDGHQNRRDKRDKRENTCQAQVQPRSGRARAPCRDHLCDPPQNKRGNQKDIDEVGKQDQPERIIAGASVQWPKNQECRQSKHRPQNHDPKGQRILHASLPSETAQLLPSASFCWAPQGDASCSLNRRGSSVAPLCGFPVQQPCCPFTSIGGGVSRGYHARSASCAKYCG